MAALRCSDLQLAVRAVGRRPSAGSLALRGGRMLAMHRRPCAPADGFSTKSLATCRYIAPASPAQPTYSSKLSSITAIADKLNAIDRKVDLATAGLTVIANKHLEGLDDIAHIPRDCESTGSREGLDVWLPASCLPLEYAPDIDAPGPDDVAAAAALSRHVVIKAALRVDQRRRDKLSQKQQQEDIKELIAMFAEEHRKESERYRHKHGLAAKKNVAEPWG